MKSQELADRLGRLHPDLLVETLVSVASQNKSCFERLLQLTATPAEKLRRFKSQLTGLRRSKKMIWRRDSNAFAQSLRDMLGLLSDPQIPTLEGLEALHSFFEAASPIFGRCDDSSGTVGDIFRIDATAAFVGFASRFEDKRHLATLLEKLLLANENGACDRLPEHIRQILPDEATRLMVGRFACLAKQEPDKNRSFSIQCMAAALASGLGDPVLYLEVCSSQEAPRLDVHLLRAAQLSLEGGDAAGALAAINRMSGKTLGVASQKTQLLVEVYRALGNRAEQESLLRSNFFATPCSRTLEPLVALTGEEGRRRLLEESRLRVLSSPHLSIGAALFLCETGQAGHAEQYVMARREAVDGSNYHSVLPLAQQMEVQQRYLVATVLYRALLESVLNASLYTGYGHAARHLHKLGDLALLVDHWETIQPHPEYEANLRTRHGRKFAFWKLHAEVTHELFEREQRPTKLRSMPTPRQ